MPCNNCNDSDLTCGCSHQHSSKCSFYFGSNLPCINVDYGVDLEVALKNINDSICTLTPSGSVYNISSCDSNISVTNTTVGNTTDVEICLNSDITTQLSNNTANITTLTNCMGGAVKDVISDSLNITEDSSNNCGRILRIEYTPSASVITYDGIIYSDSNKTGTSGATGDKILKTFTTDYTQYLLSSGDEIRILSNGEIFGDGVNVDNVKLQLFDANSSSILFTETFTGFDAVNKQSWKADWVVTYIDESGGGFLVNLDFLANSKTNGTKGGLNGVSQILVNKEVTITDLTALRIRVIYEHNSTSSATYNFARQLVVEIRKKI